MAAIEVKDDGGMAPTGAALPVSERIAPTPAPVPPRAATRPRRKKSKLYTAYLKQLHTWHWVSAAVSLAGMFLFAITGITLNHAASIAAQPQVTASEAQLPRALLGALAGAHAANAPLPQDVARAVARLVPLDPTGHAADWSDDAEVYVTMPGPGRDAWVSIDRETGKIASEKTERGWISYFNDLHKGRNSGAAWFWFIDVFAFACVVFTVTGVLLLQMHANHRPTTWPMVGFSVAVPLAIALFFIH